MLTQTGRSEAGEGVSAEQRLGARPVAGVELALVVLGGGEAVVEQHGGSGKLTTGSDRAKGGRRGDLHGEAEPRRRPW